MTFPIIISTCDSDNLKRCTKCGELKPLEAFSRDNAKRDGLYYQCKTCNAAHRAANAERITKQRREYNAANREHRREYQRKYYQTPEGKAASRAKKHRRRARKAGNSGTYTPADLAAIRAAQTDAKGRLICWRCGKPIKDAPELDHWMPLKHGGRNDAGNLHYMHAKCNREKAAKLPTELGRLL